MTTLIFIRHGQSIGNMRGEFLGHTDLDLSEKGYAQVKRTAEYIAKNYKPDKIYSSDLLRAYNTAKAVDDLVCVGIVKNKNLREIYAGEWEGKTFSQLEKHYNKDYSVWLADIGNASCTGGETVSELQERVLSEVKKIAEENNGKTIVIATHATVIRVLSCVWKGVTKDKMKDIPWGRNASVSIVDYSDGIWTPKIIGEDKFLRELSTKLPANV